MSTETTMKAHERGRAVFSQEAEAIRSIGERLDGQFDRAVDTILDCKGRVVLTGMGKHGLVARKIAATFASTGTAAFFMHPAEGLHGDLGMVNSEDVVLALSNSGSTQELLGCLPFLKHNRNFLIAMTGNTESELARQADVVLDIRVDREVCPMNLAPTTSTICAMAMGDALAVVLLERRGFQPDDFALRHPSGALGRLLRRVGDVIAKKGNPVVAQAATFGEAVKVITAARHGAVSIVDDGGQLAGILTDGDVRRTLEREAVANERTVMQLFAMPLKAYMTKEPMSVTPDTLAAKAINIMEDGPRKVLVLPVIDEHRRPVGMVHLHDLVS